MTYKDLPFGSLEEFNVLVEIPKGSELKYEYDEELDLIKLDFVFTDGFHFPHNYGLVPETLADDGDHLDAFVITDQPLGVGTVVSVRAVGLIELLDRGEGDHKLLTVPIHSPGQAKIQGIQNLDFDYEKLFTDFFTGLGKQKNKTVEIKGFHGREKAIQEIKECLARYKKQNG